METRGITFQMLQFICEHTYSDDLKLYCRYRDFCDAFKKDVECNADNCFMWARLTPPPPTRKKVGGKCEK